MKKKLLAAVLAFLCCIQSEISIPVFAGETEISVQSICNQIADAIPPSVQLYTITCDEEQNLISVVVNTGSQAHYENVKSNMMEYCQQENLTDGVTYQFFLKFDGEILPELPEEEKNALISAALQTEKYLGELAGADYAYRVFYDYFHNSLTVMCASTKIKELMEAYCEEQGFSEKYTIDYHLVYQMDENLVMSITEAAKQIQAFMESNGYEGFVSRNHYGSIFNVTGMSIAVTAYTKEDIDRIKNYCQEQGFLELCDFEFRIVKKPDPEEIFPTDAAVEIKAGDLNLDDKLNILDVIILNKAILGKEKLNSAQELAADANKDEKIDASDSLTIMKMIVGLTE